MITSTEQLAAFVECYAPVRFPDVAFFRELRESYDAASASLDNAELASRLRIEINAAHAWLSDISWLTTVYGVQGRLEGSDVPFLEQRSNESANGYLRIGYQYALWQLDRRPERAQTNVDTMLAVVAAGIADVRAGEVEKSTIANAILPAALTMSGRAARYRREDITARIEEIANDPHFSLEARRVMITKALNLRTDFPPQRLAHFITSAQAILVESPLGGVEFVRESARLGRQLAERAGDPQSDNWNRLEAEAYARLMELNPRSAIYEAAATRAIGLYRRLGDDAARIDLERRYEAEIAAQEMQTIEGEIDLREFIEAERRFIAELIDEHGGMGVIAYLVLRPGVIPRVADVKAATEQILNATIFNQFAQRVKRAPDGRTIAYSSIGAENERTQFIEQFRLHMDVCVKGAMAALNDGVASGQLTDETLHQFLNESWIGEAERFPAGNDQFAQFNIATRLMPALRRVLAVYDGEPGSDLIVAVDSLTPAVEMTLRMLARRLGIPTVVARPDPHDLLVDEVEGLGTYLRNARIRELLGEDLVTSLEVLLLEPFGFGIRDDVAHGLLFPQQYRLPIATLLTVLLLRIAAVDISAETGDARNVSED